MVPQPDRTAGSTTASRPRHWATSASTRKTSTLPEAATARRYPCVPCRATTRLQPRGGDDRRNEVLRLMHSRNSVEIDDNGSKVPGDALPGGRRRHHQAHERRVLCLDLAPLNIVPQRFPVQAPHWVFNVIQPELEQRYGKEALYRGGLRVTTTLESNLRAEGAGGTGALDQPVRGLRRTRTTVRWWQWTRERRRSDLRRLAGLLQRDDIQGRNDNAELAEFTGFDAQAVHVHDCIRKARVGAGHARSSTRRSASPTATRSSRRATHRRLPRAHQRAGRARELAEHSRRSRRHC